MLFTAFSTRSTWGGGFSSNYSFEHRKLLGWKHLDETPLSLDSSDIYCHVLDDAGFPNVVPFHGIVVVAPVAQFQRRRLLRELAQPK